MIKVTITFMMGDSTINKTEHEMYFPDEFSILALYDALLCGNVLPPIKEITLSGDFDRSYVIIPHPSYTKLIEALRPMREKE